MFSLFKKELVSFFGSIVGYIVIIIFLTINGLFLWVFPLEYNIIENGFANVDGLFILAPWVYLFLVPAVTMRSFSEEKRTGTIEIILTKPLGDLQIVLAKYLACIVIVFLSLLPTIIYVLTVWMFATPVKAGASILDWGAIEGSYYGLLLLGFAFSSIGIFSSAITNNQIVSFILSVFLCGFFYIGFEFIYSLDLFGNFDLFIKELGISAHYSSISRGVVDTRDIVYYLSLISLFLLLTKVSLQSRKW